MKYRLLLVLGAPTEEGLLAGLAELSKDKHLEKHGCIGGLSCGAEFDYSLEQVDDETPISVATVVDEVLAGAWGTAPIT